MAAVSLMKLLFKRSWRLYEPVQLAAAVYFALYSADNALLMTDVKLRFSIFTAQISTTHLGFVRFQ